jgi:hypothetical protein
VNSVPPKLIFSINSGRSGSQYLAQLLGTASKVCAFHEAEPSMSGPFLQVVCQQGLEATLTARSVKVQAIRHTLSQCPPGTVYAETNHMFIKTFYDVVMQQFGEQAVQVVRLRRYIPAVLKSFINMGYFSDRNRVWPSWMHMPGQCDSAFIPPALPREPDQYDLAIGYLLDIELRGERFKERYPGCKVHEVSLESLQSTTQTVVFLETLNLESTPATLAFPGKPVNERVGRKAEIGIATTIEYCKDRIQDYIGICQLSGVKLPGSLDKVT